MKPLKGCIVVERYVTHQGVWTDRATWRIILDGHGTHYVVGPSRLRSWASKYSARDVAHRMAKRLGIRIEE